MRRAGLVVVLAVGVLVSTAGPARAVEQVHPWLPAASWVAVTVNNTANVWRVTDTFTVQAGTNGSVKMPGTLGGSGWIEVGIACGPAPAEHRGIAYPGAGVTAALNNLPGGSACFGYVWDSQAKGWSGTPGNFTVEDGSAPPTPTPTPTPTPAPAGGDVIVTGLGPDVQAIADEWEELGRLAIFGMVFIGSVVALTLAWVAMAQMRR